MLFFIFGFFTLLSQTLLLREISFLFTAHEISIGCALAFWLFWSGAGIKIAGNIRRNVLPGEDQPFFLAFSFFALSVPLCILAARQAARIMQAGLMPGFFEMIAGTFLLTLPAAFLVGVASFAGLRARGVLFYAVESLGGAAAGIFVLYYLRYFPVFSPLKLTTCCGALLAAAGFIQEWRNRKTPKTILFCIGIIVLAWLGLQDEKSIFLKGGARPLEVYNSTGSRISVSAPAHGVTELREDGAFLAALPEETGAYEAFALPLLTRSRPKKILLAGEKSLFAAPELFKYKPALIEAAEPDLFRAKYILSKLRLNTGVVKVENTDIRQLLKLSTGGYSAIMLASGGPVNAAANRLYTTEFFKLVAQKLAPGGLLVFDLPFSENYISPEQGYLAACLIATVRQSFRNVALVPASRLIVAASDKPVNLDPAVLTELYNQKGLKNRVIVPSALPFLLNPGRLAWVQAGLAKIKNPRINSDLDPISYFYFWRLWLSMVVSPAMLLGLATAVIFIIIAFMSLFGSSFSRLEPVGISSLLIGFWTMAFEVGVILVFQTLTGQLVWKLGALFSAFLAGSTIGALLPIAAKRAGLYLAEFTAFVFSVLAVLYIGNFFSCDNNTVFLYSLFFLLLAGIISGVYFSCASALSPQKSSDVYARDLAGAALGAFTATAFVVPLWGLKAAFTLSAAAALLALLADSMTSFKTSTTRHPGKKETGLP